MVIWPWPSALPLSSSLPMPEPEPVPEHGVLVLSVATAPAQGRRDAARGAIRLAVRQVLAQVLALPLEAITIVSTPGQAPHVRIGDQTPQATAGAIGVSFSHEEGLSLAAINLHGAVGIDLMAVRAIDDWEVVARDYLGPDVALMLRAMPAPQRVRALAQAWSAHEAQLKCLGLALTEWDSGTGPESRVDYLTGPRADALAAPLAYPRADYRVIALTPVAGMTDMVASLALPV